MKTAVNTAAVIENLKDMLGPDKVITDERTLKEDLVNYIGYRMYEIYKGQYLAPLPICVVKPDDVSKVSAVLSYLNEHHVNCIPKTGRSGSTAGGEPEDDMTVILDGSSMDKIIKFDEENMLVTVQCGTRLEYLENYCNQRGYTTGHFPQSLPMAQVGGLIATRSIGQFSTLYGGIEDLVVGLRAVLPNGEMINIKNVPRRAAGPDIRHMIIGSEGALVFITEATLKLFKFDIKNRWMHAYAVKDMDNGLRILQEIMTSGYKPSVARLHDNWEANHSYRKFIKDGESILLFIADGPKDISKVTGAAIDRIARKGGARSVGTKPCQMWVLHRNDYCYTMLDNEDLRSGFVYDTLEVASNWSEISKIYSSVCERVAKEDFPGLVRFSGHSSHSYLNGTNIYFMFAYKAVEDMQVNKDRFYQMIGMIIDETLRLNGTMAHHHGIGRYRVPWMKAEYGSSYVLLRKLKDAIDPNGIMNHGTLFAE